MNQRKSNGAWYTPVSDFILGNEVINNTFDNDDTGRWGAKGVVWQTDESDYSLKGGILIKWRTGPDTGKVTNISKLCQSLMSPIQ